MASLSAREDREAISIMAVCEVTMSKGKKVLVVDDDELIRGVICRFLGKRRFEAHSARDGADAIEFLEGKGHLDIVITDYSMPRINGIELTRIIKDRYPRMIVIGMSGFGTAEEDFMKAGAHAFFRKPFFMREVMCTIDRVVSR